jgi:hypothetical protein
MTETFVVIIDSEGVFFLPKAPLHRVGYFLEDSA